MIKSLINVTFITVRGIFLKKKKTTGMGQMEKGTQANTTLIPIKVGKCRLLTKIINQYAVITEKIFPMQENNNEKISYRGHSGKYYPLLSDFAL